MLPVVPSLIALAVSAAITPLVRGSARALGIVSRPSADRWNERPTALLGGVGIFAAFIVGTVAIAIQGASHGVSIWHEFGASGAGILLASTIMFVTGFADDRLDFRPATKLVLQAVAAAALISSGVILPVTGWLAANTIVTFFWFIGITNAMNLLDNMDGVAAGVAAVAALALGAAFARAGSPALMMLCLVVAGSAAGFLPYNFHRASIFMGDSGSLFLGAMLAGLGAAYPRAASGNVLAVLAIPVFVVVVPILDTFLVTISRTLSGRPISMGGRDHTTHRLVALGLSQRQTALLLYALSSAAGLAALLLPDTLLGLWVAVAFLVALGVLAAYLLKMHSYPTVAPADRTRPLTILVADLLHKRRALEVMLDLVLFGAAHTGAYLLRYDGVIPSTQVQVLQRTLAVAVGARLVGFLAAGVYRSPWQLVGDLDFFRLLKGLVYGTLVTIATFVFVFREAEFARSILLIDAMLVLLLTTAVRFSFRSLDLLNRQPSRRAGANTLIYGAGRFGETIVRRQLGDADAHLRPIGFIDDDPTKRGRMVHGLPVWGSAVDLHTLLIEKRVEKIVIAATLSTERLFDVLAIAADAGVEALRLQVTFEPMTTDEIAAVSLDDEPAVAQVRVGHSHPMTA